MFNRLTGIVKANARYVLLGTLLFVGSGFLGYLNANMLQQIAQELMQQLDQIADKIGEQGGGPLYTFWVIFKNNVLASLSMLGLGVFFGVFPIFALISNGILLGFMLNLFAMQGLNPLSVLLIGIVPHGIIEIFAVILAAAIGIKYGFYIIKLMTHLFSTKRSAIFNEFKENLRDLPFIVVSLIFLLFIAAIIESTVTPFLIYTFFGDLSGVSA